MDTQQTNTALVTVATVGQNYEAYILKGLLEEEGIAVYLKDELFSQLLAGVSGGIKLQVSGADAEKARELINQNH